MPDSRRADGDDDRPRRAGRATPERGSRRRTSSDAGTRRSAQPRRRTTGGSGARRSSESQGRTGDDRQTRSGRRAEPGASRDGRRSTSSRSGRDGGRRDRDSVRDGTGRDRDQVRDRGRRDRDQVRDRSGRDRDQVRDRSGRDRDQVRDRGGRTSRTSGDPGGRAARAADDAPRSGFGPHASHAAARSRRGTPPRPSLAGKQGAAGRGRAGRGRNPARVRIVRGRQGPDETATPAKAKAKAKARRRPPAPDAAARARPTRRRRGPSDVRDEILRLGGRTGERSYQRLLQAADDFADDRARDALRILRPLRESLPQSPSVRELLGLSLYRVGRFADAAKELDAYHAMTGEVTQHPVLMDCARALGDHRRVDALWHELAEASPSAELVTEGRIVRAATLADEGKLDAALAQLRGRAKAPKRVRDHHLRLWYALADLEERAGNLAPARTLFQRIRSHDAAFADVAERLAALG